MQEVAGSSPVFSIWKPRNLQEKHCFSFDLRGFLRFDAVLSGVLLGFDFQFDGSHGIDRMYGIGMDSWVDGKNRMRGITVHLSPSSHDSHGFPFPPRRFIFRGDYCGSSVEPWSFVRVGRLVR